MIHLNISKKITGGFLLIAVITGIVGIFGYSGMLKIKSRQQEFVNFHLKALSSASSILESLSTISSSERALMIPKIIKDSTERKRHFAKLAFGRLKEADAAFDSLPYSTKEQNIWKEYKSSYATWMITYDKFISLINKKAGLF